MAIKAITFDFWSTLYESKVIDYTERVRRLKEWVEQYSGVTFDPQQFEAAVNVARDTWSQAWTEAYRTIAADEWLHIVLNELNITLSLAHFSKIQTNIETSVLNDLPELVPEAQTVLAELSARYRLAIISDTGLTPGRVLCQLLERDGLIGYFTHLTFSDEVGYSKPHPEAFLTTLAALGVEPHQAVHVGDLLRTDIAGAQKVGMRAVQYIGINRGGQSILANVPPTQVRPDAIIRSHMELKPLLQQWNGLD